MYKVVIVEDDLAFAEIVMESLQMEPDFIVHDILTNIADATRKFEAGQLNDIDAVLLDLQLPEFRGQSTINPNGGFELLELIRLKHNFCGKVIVLTNSHSLADGERAMLSGGDGYLCKFLRTAELPHLLAELKMAIRNDVVLLASEMRYVFLSHRQSAHSQNA